MLKPLGKRISSVAGKFVPFYLILWLFLIPACSNSISDTHDIIFTLAVPSENERVFGEKRDFYVVGYFEAGASEPVNVRIELFKDEDRLNLVRLIESRVDVSGVTPDAAIAVNYSEGQEWDLDKAPDLVNAPGGFYYPGNKVLVTDTYFAGLILGGATKDFDTDYVDGTGAPLEDLTEGAYILCVTALAGNTVLQREIVRLYFEPAFKLFGAFRPDNHKSKFWAYAEDNGYRMFNDPFAGYFFTQGVSGVYEIKKRWTAQNSLEVVNTNQGVSYGTPENSQIGFILYNLAETSTTARLEIGKALHTGVIDSPDTLFFFYDIGEPEITFTTMDLERETLDGNIVVLDYDDRLALTRAEIRTAGTGDGENRYSLYDETPRIIDLDYADGIEIASGQEFSVFGVVTPIPTLVNEVSHLYYAADNRISTIRYQISDTSDDAIYIINREINLGRVYIESEPDWLFYSIFEFEHDFDFNAMGFFPGIYDIQLVGLDNAGNEIWGTYETFRVTYGDVGDVVNLLTLCTTPSPS